jgi:hypothetical protein
MMLAAVDSKTFSVKTKIRFPFQAVPNSERVPFTEQEVPIAVIKVAVFPLFATFSDKVQFFVYPGLFLINQ